MEQLDIFTAAFHRDQAVKQVERHADPEWLLAARRAVAELAHTRTEFISDDVWTLIEKPSEARALGPVMLWAQREGLIAPTDRVRQSAQPKCHAMPRRVWRSLAYRAAS